MKLYRGFPRRLHHSVPSWVESGALFHIRIAVDGEKQKIELTTPQLAQSILASVRLYEDKFRWQVTLFVLMPDHLHALVCRSQPIIR